MYFNIINKLNICYESVKETVPVDLVLYSHLTAVVVSLFIGILIFIKNKRKEGLILFLISIFFSLWAISAIVLWISYSGQLYVFFWSIILIFEFLFLSLFLYLILTLFNEKKRGENIFQIVFILIFSSVAILIPKEINIAYFDATQCYPISGGLYEKYIFVLYIFIFIYFIFSYFKKNKEIQDKNHKKQFNLISLGSFVFITSFISANFLADYFINNEILSISDSYKFEMYSIFFITFFFAILGFIIVRFNAFNIKLLGAQALVFALIVLVGAQFLYTREMPLTSIVLTTVTFLLSILIGVLVIKSVKKLDAQRELLDIANKNQQSLLHFITHQVKGYLTKSRNIFDGMVAGDYDPISDRALEMAKHGFDSDTRGVETVMAILKASDLKTGKTAFAKEKANISALVAEIIENRKDAAISKGLEFSFEIEPNIETQVDQLQIKEVFKNLITNSILYTQKGTVHVVLKRENGKVKFSVVDTGVGLSPQDKAKLFTEGGKGELSSLVNVDSTGYGLYIAKQIVEQHGGTIEAVSKGKDKGSEFFVLLP